MTKEREKSKMIPRFLVWTVGLLNWEDERKNRIIYFDIEIIKNGDEEGDSC